MTPLSGLAPRTVTPLETPASASITGTSLSSRLQALNLTIVSSPDGIEGPGGEIRIRLENPTIGPEDIPLNEFLQQLDTLSQTPAQVLVLGETLHQLGTASDALGRSIQTASTDGSGTDLASVVALFTNLETQAALVERSLRDLIENSTYPNFSDFLKELVRIAQDLREASSEARLAAIQGNYTQLVAAADQMVIAAEKSQASREAQIEADKKEAIGNIVAGGVSLLVTIGFGAAAGATGSSSLISLGSSIGQASTSIITGSFSVSVTNKKLESSDLQSEADLANVAKQRLEAAAKLIEAQTEVARELGEIAKALRDMVVKLYQDFISSQNQAVQRANV